MSSVVWTRNRGPFERIGMPDMRVEGYTVLLSTDTFMVPFPRETRGMKLR